MSGHFAAARLDGGLALNGFKHVTVHPFAVTDAVGQQTLYANGANAARYGAEYASHFTTGVGKWYESSCVEAQLEFDLDGVFLLRTWDLGRP